MMYASLPSSSSGYKLSKVLRSGMGPWVGWDSSSAGRVSCVGRLTTGLEGRVHSDPPRLFRGFRRLQVLALRGEENSGSNGGGRRLVEDEPEAIVGEFACEALQEHELAFLRNRPTIS